MPHFLLGCGWSREHRLGRLHEKAVRAKLRQQVEAPTVAYSLVHRGDRGNRRRGGRSGRVGLPVLLLPTEKTTHSGHAAARRASGHGTADARRGALRVPRIVPSRPGRCSVPCAVLPAPGGAARANGTPRWSQHGGPLATAVDTADAFAYRATRTTAALQLQGELPALRRDLRDPEFARRPISEAITLH